MLGGLGFAYTDLGDYSKAIEYHTAALAIAREIGDRQNADIHLGELGIVHRKSWGTTRRPSRTQLNYGQSYYGGASPELQITMGAPCLHGLLCTRTPL
jgi:tetratricopeptide (TPR) repeat protein